MTVWVGGVSILGFLGWRWFGDFSPPLTAVVVVHVLGLNLVFLSPTFYCLLRHFSLLFSSFPPLTAISTRMLLALSQFTTRRPSCWGINTLALLLSILATSLCTGLVVLFVSPFSSLTGLFSSSFLDYNRSLLPEPEDWFRVRCAALQLSQVRTATCIGGQLLLVAGLPVC